MFSRSNEQKITNIPLEWEHNNADIISKELTKFNHTHPYRIHYLGPRPAHSLQIHKKYGRSERVTQEIKYPSTQKQLYTVNLQNINPCSFVGKQSSQNKTMLFYRAFEGTNPSLPNTPDYVFNSAFQSGNLDCVVKKKPEEFDLFLRIDSNTRGHTGWYYFSIKNGCFKEKISLNICNLRRPSPLYSEGMRPYVYSRLSNSFQGSQWQQSGQNIRFAPCQLSYSHISDRIDTTDFFKLSFDYEFKYSEDQVFFAYCIPYTYSQLQQDIRGYVQSPFVKQLSLGKSLTGLDLPMLHITNHQSQEKKKIIIVTGRVHPGQSNSSHMVRGLIEGLLGESQEISELRSTTHIFVVPMLNPDGVVMGNTRTSAAGKDLNRQFISPQPELYPECYQLKGLVSQLQQMGEVMLYLDFHGHSRRKNTFLYGPNYQLQHLEYYQFRFLPKLIEKNNQTFRYFSCNFAIPDDKKATARAVMLNQFKIPFVCTIQSSIGLFYSPATMKIQPFTAKLWTFMGQDISKAIQKFKVIITQQEIIERKRSINRYKQNNRASTSMANRKVKRYSTEQYLDFVTASKSTNTINTTLYTQLMKQVINSSNADKNDENQESDDHDQEESLPTDKANIFKQHLTQIIKKNRIILEDEKQCYLQEVTVKPFSYTYFGPKEQKTETIMKRISPPKMLKTSTLYFKEKASNNTAKTIEFVSSSEKKSISPQYALQTRKTYEQKRSTVNSLNKYKPKVFSCGISRYSLTVKNLYPAEAREEESTISKNLQAIRKEMKKGRILISNLEQSRMRFLQKERNSNIKKQRRGPFVSADLSKMRMGNRSSASYFDNTPTYYNTPHQSKNYIQQDSNYAPIQGLEVDSLAMTITAFKRR